MNAAAESDLARLSRITDSVFAVVITLLAYRVRLPGREALAAPSLAALTPFLADLGALAISFLVASLYWLAHWAVFRRMHGVDFRFVTLHFAFLGGMVLLPLTTSLMSAAAGERIGAFAYSVNLFFLAAMQTLFRAHARRLEPQAFGGAVPLLLTSALLTTLFGIATVLSLTEPAAARWVWWASLLTPFVERRWGLARAGREVRPQPS